MTEPVTREGIDLIEASHLVDNDYYDKLESWSCLKCCCGLYCILPIVLIYLLVAGFPGVIELVQ